MSRWETVSIKREDGSTDSVTRFIKSSGTQSATVVPTRGEGLSFDGPVCFVPHDTVESYIVAVSDTSDNGTIYRVNTDESWWVHRHEGSLWTATVRHGPSYDWHDDILEELPDWVSVGGNWSKMDR